MLNANTEKKRTRTETEGSDNSLKIKCNKTEYMVTSRENFTKF